MRFNDEDYLRAYYDSHQFPKIHDDIFNTAIKLKMRNVVDLGCCYGLLAVRLAPYCEKVIGVEPSDDYLRKAVRNSKVKYVKMFVKPDTIAEFRNLLYNNDVDTVIARRVVPEIYETGGKALVNDFCRAMAESGVKRIVLEGRKSNRNAVNPLCNADREVLALSSRYREMTSLSYKNCRVLELKL